MERLGVQEFTEAFVKFFLTFQNGAKKATSSFRKKSFMKDLQDLKDLYSQSMKDLYSQSSVCLYDTYFGVSARLIPKFGSLNSSSSLDDTD